MVGAWQTHLRELLNRSEKACQGRHANYADPGETLPETDALTFFEEELLSPIQHLVRIFTLYGTGQCELRGHVGNLFQNGPQFVRDIHRRYEDVVNQMVSQGSTQEAASAFSGLAYSHGTCRGSNLHTS